MKFEWDVNFRGVEKYPGFPWGRRDLISLRNYGLVKFVTSGKKHLKGASSKQQALLVSFI